MEKNNGGLLVEVREVAELLEELRKIIYAQEISASYMVEDAIKREYSPEHVAYLEGIQSGVIACKKIVSDKTKEIKDRLNGGGNV